VGGLFLLSRRSQGGVGGPGGNNPLAFGKSKAKFQMEPNTGITFDDVAGVDEAKQDFMEVCIASSKDTQFPSCYCLQWYSAATACKDIQQKS
jgi:cell division protease FtsH